jgi:21S rRNA (uridine2791-2'-O)-methyltransferase
LISYVPRYPQHLEYKLNDGKGYAPGSWSQVAVERTKPNGRIVGIDIIPAQPPKGVSTIQGNFLSDGVREQVKLFLQDPNHGRPLASLSAPIETTDSATGEDIVSGEPSLNADTETAEKVAPTKAKRKTQDDSGKIVDVVLSDMSEPWPLENPSYWKRSLSDPYIRMMNTSGINYKDHAGSMVWNIPLVSN